MSSYGTDSFPTRFLQGQDSSDDRHLALKVYAGEVLAAFDDTAISLDKHQIKSVSGGMRSAQFPKTWKATAEYHQAGRELLGNDIDTSEITVTIDGLLVSHTAIYDVDRKIAHFDVEGEFTAELGRSLARVYDRNVMRAIIQASRVASDGPFPGGHLVEDSALAADGNGRYDGKAWIDSIIAANELFYEADVPEEMPRYLAVDMAVFNAIKWAKDTNGQYLLIDRDFGGSNQVQRHERSLNVDGVTVLPTKRLPTADESADTGVWSKYRANYTGVLGAMWTPMAVATILMQDVGLETERDARRQETFMIAKMLAGHGTLRPECAIEFRATARP